jgi:phosphohistidine phosphatase
VLLILFRHGIAIDRGDPACPREEDRFLTDEGIKRTESAARGLARLGLHPGRIMSSPWLRARQTAEIAARALDFDEDRIEITDALLPFSPVSAILEETSDSAVRQVLVTGHAPHLDEVLDEVVGIGGYGGTRLKKAGAAAVEFTVSSPGAGRLEWFIPPRALRALGDT